MDMGRMLTRRRKSGSEQTRAMIADRIAGSGSTARISALQASIIALTNGSLYMLAMIANVLRPPITLGLGGKDACDMA